MKITALKDHGVDDRIIQAWAAAGIKEFLPIQILAVRRGKVLDGGSAVIFSPTSSGKTFVGEMAAVRTARRNRRVIYLVPQKALAEEKYQEFKSKYATFGVRVVISTRDRKKHDRAIHRGEFHIAVIVFEKFQSLMVASPALLRNVGLAVIDELQMIGDKTRGAGLEVLLTKILLSPDKPQIIGLSAVLGNAQGLAGWLGATLCEEWKRPVELRKGVLFDGKFRYLEHNSGDEGTERFKHAAEDAKPIDVLVSEACALAGKGEQCLVFCKSRQDTMKMADRIAETIAAKPASHALEDLGHLEDSQGKDILTKLLGCGVAYHNADLDWDQRSVIERWFRQGEISVVCATTTLAMGINLPARNVFVDPNRWDQDRTGRWIKVPISQAEYENISGRAGRLGLEDEFGRAILVAESEFQADMFFGTYVKGHLEDVKPALDDAPLSQHVLNLVASRLCRTKQELRDILLASYTGSLYWRGDENEASFKEKLDEAVEHCLSGDLMARGKKGIEATALGKLTAAKGVSVDTAIEMAAFAKKRLEAAASVDPFEILWCLTGTENGEGIHFNLSTPEHRNGEFQDLLFKTIAGFPEDTGNRVAEEMEGFSSSYDEVKRTKKTLLLYDWIQGIPTRKVENRFHCYSGSIQGLAGEFAWLAETMAGIAKVLGWPEEPVAHLMAFSRQLIYGVPVEGIDLASLRVRGLGRGRIVKLVEKGLTSLEEIVAAPPKDLKKLLTTPVAEALLKRARESVQVREITEAQDASGPNEVTGEPPDGPEYTEWPEEYPPSDDMGATYLSDVTIHIDGRASGRRHLVKLDDEEAWLTERSFEVALKLAVAAKKTDLGWLGCDQVGTYETYHQAIRRLKKDLSVGGIEPDKLVENNRAKQYRFSVPPSKITIDHAMVVRHFNQGKAILVAFDSPCDP